MLAIFMLGKFGVTLSFMISAPEQSESEGQENGQLD